MIRLHIACEGQTEEVFVRTVIAPHLGSFHVFATATIVGTPKRRASAPLRKGGGGWQLWERDLRRLLDGPTPDLRVTTLFDLYGLPDGFPGRDGFAAITDTVRRCVQIERALSDHFDDRRFLPYLQRHEFEALVLGALPALREMLDAREDVDGVDRLEVEIGNHSPEDIDDEAASAPSKRLKRHVPSYRKLVHGPTAVEAIGLVTLRRKCPKFDSWLSQLESLNETPLW